MHDDMMDAARYHWLVPGPFTSRSPPPPPPRPPPPPQRPKSEGFPRTGYLVPARGGLGVWEEGPVVFPSSVSPGWGGVGWEGGGGTSNQ